MRRFWAKSSSEAPRHLAPRPPIVSGCEGSASERGKTAFLCLLVFLSAARLAEAQLPGPDPDPAEPDFTVISVATTAQVPRHKFAFKLSHRFSRPLDGFSDDFHVGELVENLFGFASGCWKVRRSVCTGPTTGRSSSSVSTASSTKARAALWPSMRW